MKGQTKNLDKDLAPLFKKHKVKAESLLHLDPGHKIVWTFEAPTAESVRDLIYESGLSRWNDFEFYLASSLEDITAWTDKLPSIW